MARHLVLTRALLAAVGEEECARMMMPLADSGSQAMLAGSGLLQMLAQDSEAPSHRRPDRHDDVTGFYQRRKGKR